MAMRHIYADESVRWVTVIQTSGLPEGYVPPSASLSKGTMPVPLRATTGEPLLHTGITDQLPTHHPHAYTTLYCVRCDVMVHASNNENMELWIETNTGSYCIDCFTKAYDEYEINQEQLEIKLGFESMNDINWCVGVGKDTVHNNPSCTGYNKKNS